jgi:heat shock protein HtpX
MLSVFVWIAMILLINAITGKVVLHDGISKVESGFFGDFATWLLLIGWITLCYLSPFLFSRIYKLWLNWRLPIREEQNLFEKCANEVLEKAKHSQKISILIEEDLATSASAFGINNIVLSKGLLKTMDEGQIKAVIAHELGHLKNKDTYFSSVIFFCELFFSPLRYVLNLIWALIKSYFFIAIFTIVFLLVIGSSAGIKSQQITTMAVFSLVLTFIISCLLKGLHYIYLMLSRSIEFARDLYAFKLGYGTQLEKSLLHLSEISPQKGSAFFYLTSTHPIIQNRIRRLEKLNAKQN